VLGSVAGNSSQFAVVHAEGDVESDHSLARLNHIKVLLLDTSLFCSVVEMKFDLFKETGLTVLIKTGTSSCHSRHLAGTNSRSLFAEA
jgi:hypothetical protein